VDLCVQTVKVAFRAELQGSLVTTSLVYYQPLVDAVDDKSSQVARRSA
jgi:hypothetical protein